MSKIRQILRSLVMALVLVLIASGQDRSLTSRVTTEVARNPSPPSTVYLPHVVHAGSFHENRPIWTAPGTPDSHEVALFRRDFTIGESLRDTELRVFADTRYELWVNGIWVGRGPSRFSRTTREYDVYRLGDLQPGRHLIAVLVQWAPNTRRSESTSPALLAHVEGITDKVKEVIVRTGPDWKALQSEAWRADAVPVHEWELIGPTELVDLRKLPHDWMLPSFCDEDWPATAVNPTSQSAVYRPRTIPILDQIPITPTVITAGPLSPGYAIGELAHSDSPSYSLTLEALETTELIVEALTGTQVSLSGLVSTSGNDLEWERSGASRPDVYRGSTTIEAGSYSLQFADIPVQGLTFGVSTAGISLMSVPFGQGVHAGRRLLLAKPDDSPGAVSVSSRAGLTVTFDETPAYAVLDLGRVVHGRLVADVSGPSGAIVDVGWDERLLPDTLRPLPHPGSLHPQWNQTDSWVLDGSARSISTIDARAGRYVLVAAWNGGPVKLQDIQIYEERYPVILRGEFTSSNALLDEIWQVGVDTLYPSMTDAYTDTPWRERGQWWGDVYVAEHINQVAFGDTALVGRGLLFMAEQFVGGRPAARAPHGGDELLLDYGMLWVQSLHRYYEITEDGGLLTMIYPTLSEFMAYLDDYESSSTGLLDIPYGEWWETALVDWQAPHSRYGQSAAINALYYGTLMDGSRLAEAMGEQDDAEAWREKADRVRDQINLDLYLPVDRRYATTIHQTEVIAPSVHSQAWPLATGVVPDESLDDVASALLELLEAEAGSASSPGAGIYGMFWIVEALGQGGRIAEAVKLIEMYYGRLLDLGATTWWEGFNSHLSYAASLSHSWGGAPTWFLSSHVLGARRSGADAWEVKPAFSGVEYARGTLPLREGYLKVHWERWGSTEAYVELSAPPDTTGKVVVCGDSFRTTLTLNERLVWREGEALAEGITVQEGELHVSLSGGDHTLRIRWDWERSSLPIMTGEGSDASG